MSFLERWFGNAFSSPTEADLSPEEQERERLLFEKIAAAVVKRGLTTPAILFLEMHRPLGYVAGQFTYGIGPFASVIFDPADVKALARSLCRRDGIEKLLVTIEEYDCKLACNDQQGEREV